IGSRARPALHRLPDGSAPATVESASRRPVHEVRELRTHPLRGQSPRAPAGEQTETGRVGGCRRHTERAHRMKRICVDMDEVLADALGELIRRYNAEFHENLTVQDMWGNWMVNVLPASRQNRLMAYLQEEDFFEDLDVMPDSQRVVELLSRHYEIFIATAAMEFPK